MEEKNQGQTIDLERLCALQKKPPLFEPGEERFWTDEHIAQQMLKAHLNPNSDAASRRPETIERSVEWLVSRLNLKAGMCVLDLGCGPGLYAARLAQRGLRVMGVDFSLNSIQYAVQSAQAQGLDIVYRCQDYLTLDDEACYDTALLIYGDLCPLSPSQRRQLLANVRRALKPGGYFVLDVTTPALRRREGLKKDWYASPGGFWKPAPHLVLEQGFSYEGDVYLDQYIVLEADGKISVYRNWFQDYTPQSIRAELEEAGFVIHSLWNDLLGTPLTENSDWIGVIAQKKPQPRHPVFYNLIGFTRKNETNKEKS